MSRWIDGLEAAAAEVLPEPVHRYFRQGARDGVTAAEAAAAWRGYRLRPRVLRDVSSVSIETTILGRRAETPVAVAPTSMQRAAHPDGEVEMARGAAAAGSLVCVSSNSGSTYDAIAETGVAWWAQVYVLRNRALTKGMLGRAMAAGARALVLTVDTPVAGTKYDDGPSVWDPMPEGHAMANLDLADAVDGDLDKATDLTPETIRWLAEATGLPVVVKGVLRGDDAARAVEAGAAGIWVSNHGGRQLDRSISTAAALPEVAQAVAGAAEVYVDGGVRSGLDVLTALSLGARAVFVGRPALWALSVSGSAGVRRLLAELSDELRDALLLSGCAHLADLAPADVIFSGIAP